MFIFANCRFHDLKAREAQLSESERNELKALAEIFEPEMVGRMNENSGI